ncbi:MAG: PAS domain S-box protein [Promethearchaeota archaeon]
MLNNQLVKKPVYSDIKIVLIRDDLGDAHVIQELLNDAIDFNYSLIVIDSLKEGIDYFDENSCDVIFLDLNLIDYSCLDLILKLRIIVKQIPIIVLSTLNNQAIARKADQLGVQDYLIKDQIDKNQLIRSIYHAIDRNNLLQKIQSLADSLQENELMIKRIIENLEECILIIDENRIVRFLNRAAEKFFELNKDEFIGKKYEFPLNFSKRSSITFKLQPDIEKVAEMNMVSIVWEGDPALLLSLRDITELKDSKKVVKKLGQALLEMDALIENAPLAIFIIRQNGNILRINKEALNLTGYKEEEILNLSIYELLKDNNLVIKHFEEDIYDLSKPNTIEATFISKTGRVIEVEITSNILKIAENLIIQSFFSDITERKASEKHRDLLLDHLVNSLEFKSKFFAAMSHELRTPLNAILGFSQLLLEESYGNLNEDQLEFLNDINSAGDHLLSLINSILDLSKIEAGKFELNFEKFNLIEVLLEVDRIVKPLYKKKNLNLIIEGIEKIQSTTEIYADLSRFKQVLYNLISNSIKFTEKGVIILRCIERIDHWEFQVLDTGIGIHPSDYDVVFREFSRVENDQIKNIPGAGLGLALTKRLVNLHGGEIWFESEYGKGSIFYFTMPKKKIKNKTRGDAI